MANAVKAPYEFQSHMPPEFESACTKDVLFTIVVMHQFVGWLNQNADGSWVPRSILIETPYGEVYMRRDRTASYIHGQVMETITMSRVDIHKEHQSQGLYRTLCEVVDKFADAHDWGVNHENTHEPRLAALWERQGLCKTTDFGPSYLRLPKSMRT